MAVLLEELVNQHRDQLSKSEKEVLDIILSDQKSYARCTSTELADTCHISRTTLLRICRKIGLMSFSDLKVILKNSSETQAKSQRMDFDYICNIYHNLIDELNKTVGKDERHQITNQILDITHEDLANSYISYNDNIVGMSKDVENLKATPEGIYLIDYKVDIKQ